MLELHFKEIFDHKIAVVKELCQRLHEGQTLQVSPGEIDALSSNMVVVDSYWLSYQYILNPRQYTGQTIVKHALASGCYQVLSLMHTYLPAR